MVVTNEHGYQIHLPERGQENLQGIVRFAAGTVIYIEGRQTAVLQKDCFAKPTGGKRRGLKEYVALSRLDLYLDNRFWSRPEGTLFTAYKKMAHKL